MTEEDKYQDLPVPEAIALANDLIDKGATIYMKFTCEQCGNRLFFEEPNSFYEEGVCDKCGHTTKIKKCGFMVLAKL